MIKAFVYLGMLLTLNGLISCGGKKAAAGGEADAPKEEAVTPVTVTEVTKEQLEEFTDLNATSTYLTNNVVKSNINGYIRAVDIKPGQFIHSGQSLFTLRTKEAEALGNTINKLDPSYHFTGTITVKAPLNGYVTQLLHQLGDYVQDGEQLATINDVNSFGFVLNVPFELRRYVSIGRTVQIILPDSTHLNGTVAIILPAIDSITQTQRTLVKVNTSTSIPENLIARVRILKSTRTAPALPKAAVLTDDAQSNFWVMKMIDSATAVKVPVIKGMETADKVEILRPLFHPGDRVLLSGNYGLPDTAKVKIVKEAE
jgi:multidrug efflux pump subunit AcrA (membrane-fusion protein)